MSYDPTEPTPKDVIRGLAGDTSNDADSEILQDATYLAVMARWGVGSGVGEPMDTAGYYRAAAEILRRTAVQLQNRPSSISAPSDGSLSWASRTKALEDTAKEMESIALKLEEADADTNWFGPVVTVRDRFMTGGGGSEW